MTDLAKRMGVRVTDAEKLQAIYDTETHCSLSWFWDGGFTAEYGLHSDHLVSKAFDTAKEAIDWLYSKHMEHKK